MKQERLYEAVKHTFTQDEVRELGQALAREAQNVSDLRDQRKATAAEFGARIEAANTRVNDLTMRINNGYELREVECVAEFDRPNPGTKAIVRLDNPDDVIRYEPMTAAEMQSTFGFSEGGPEPE